MLDRYDFILVLRNGVQFLFRPGTICFRGILRGPPLPTHTWAAGPEILLLFPYGFDEPSEILPGPDHRHGVQGVRFLFGPGDHLVDVLVLDHIELVGKTHLFVGLLDPADEGVGLFRIVAACQDTTVADVKKQPISKTIGMLANSLRVMTGFFGCCLHMARNM